MSKTTEIEKESLEAHVELCAQRYEIMASTISNMEKRLNTVDSVLKEIKNILQEKETQAYKKLISLGITVIGSLLTTLIGLVMYIMKNQLF
jgi:flagellar capping protein FliD